MALAAHSKDSWQDLLMETDYEKIIERMIESNNLNALMIGKRNFTVSCV
jgi:hypothetical protein